MKPISLERKGEPILVSFPHSLAAFVVQPRQTLKHPMPATAILELLRSESVCIFNYIGMHNYIQSVSQPPGTSLDCSPSLPFSSSLLITVYSMTTVNSCFDPTKVSHSEMRRT